MEILLAIVVASAVIFFGALISMGNERQRKAIDDLREQAVLWAVQDLQLKRERFVREVKVEHPLSWLNSVALKACGYNLDLKVIELFETPEVLLCTSTDGQLKVLFTLLSPADLGNIRKKKINPLGKFIGHNPLLSLPKNTTVHDMSPLKYGLLFDLELELVWKELTGRKPESATRLWIYELPVSTPM